jgi:DNA-binding LytR/AlgR family response regulator
MSNLKCLTVDDERAAHLVLQNYIGRVERLEHVGACYSGVEAINFLHKTPVDILFLDINMPEMTGLELLKTLQNPPKIILTTAYSEFALDGFELGVSDYLLKPIPFPRFLKAVNRILNETIAPVELSVMPEPVREFAFIQVDNESLKLEFSTIRYIQSWGNYVKIFTEKKMLLTAMTTTDFENLLPETAFVRCHKSFIIAIARVQKIGGGRIWIGDEEIPIGNTFRQKVLERVRG